MPAFPKLPAAPELAASYRAHVTRLQEGYEAVLERYGLSAIVLASGVAASRNRFDDQYWPLLPTPAFAHWLPLAEPEAYLVVRGGQRPLLVRTVVEDFWETLPERESEHFWDSFEVVSVAEAAARRALADLAPDKVAFFSRDPEQAPAGVRTNPADVLSALDVLRTQKSAYELTCLAVASARAALGHRRAAELFAAADPSELEIHLAYLGASEQDDSATPYKNIVALGAHTAVLHYIAYQRRSPGRADQSLLVDAGAKVLGYGSDITRSHARGEGPAARRFAELIAAMDRLERAVCELVTVGMEYEALHDHSHRLLAQLLRDVGLALPKASVEELVSRGVTRKLFPHGLGHSLGITVHDAGMRPRLPRAENRFLRTTTAIAPGQVFTIEPGLYFIPALVAELRATAGELVDWGLVEELAPFGGIRIEDNIAVLPGSTPAATEIRNLTREAFAASS
jgi:Xaa-Pro dipeptidase